MVTIPRQKRGIKLKRGTTNERGFTNFYTWQYILKQPSFPAVAAAVPFFRLAYYDDSHLFTPETDVTRRSCCWYTHTWKKKKSNTHETEANYTP